MQPTNYAVSPDAQRAFAVVKEYLRPAPLLVVISGPSGVGKDSVVKRMREMGYPFEFVVTVTSRPPREHEREGEDYYFVGRQEFERMIADDELIEHAQVYGQYKGVPRVRIQRALQSGSDVIMRLDVQGAATIRRLVPQSLSVFLVPPSLEALVDRLRRRGGDSPEQVRHRIQTVLQEMETIRDFDYVVVNEEGMITEAVEQIAAIITAEKCRTVRRKVEV